jgi:hypothetical protein
MRDRIIAEVAGHVPELLGAVGDLLVPGEESRQALAPLIKSLAVLQAEQRLEPSEFLADLITSKEVEIAAEVETGRLIASWRSIDDRKAFLGTVGRIAFKVGIKVAEAALRG